MLKEETNFVSSFSSFTEVGKEEINESPEAISEKVSKLIQEVVNYKFAQPAKRHVSANSEKINFACPYCGDSDKNSHKKRGNLFLDSLHYHCFNCLIHRNLHAFLADFDKDKMLSPQEFMQLQDVAKRNQLRFNKRSDFSWDSLLGANLKEVLPLKKDFMDKLNLLPIEASNFWIKNYLKDRLQMNWQNMAYLPEKNHLYIFNQSEDGERIIGYQIRQFKSDVKYLSYNLLKVYESLELEVTKDVEELNKLSLIFNILKVDFNLPVTIFEGPLDCFLFNNAVATSSANNKMPFDIGNKRFMYDNPNVDKTGKKKSIEAITTGDSVFLWTKYLKENKLPLTLKDWNDLLIYAIKHKIKLVRPDGYFSESKFDIYYL